MNKNLHDTDEFFQSAYQQFEEDPSPAVWEKLTMALDNMDNKSAEERFIVLKRAVIFLLLIFCGFILNEYSPLKRGKGLSIKESKPVSFSTEEKNNVPEVLNTDYRIRERENRLPGKEVLINDHSTFLPLIVNSKIETGLTRFNSLVGMATTSGEILSFDKRKPGPTGSLTVQANNDNRQKGKPGNFTPYWQLSAFASYDRVNYKLDGEEPNSIRSIKHSEIHEPSYSAGVYLTRQVTQHWGLQTGLLYSHIAIGISPQKMYAFQDPAGGIAYKYVTSSGYAYVKPPFGPPPSSGDSLTADESEHTLKTISIPLIVKYQAGKNKLSIIPGIGIEANFITRARVEVDLLDAFNHEIVTTNKLYGVKNFYWSAVADAEIRYQLSKKVSVNINPSFRYAVSPITENNIVETYPYSFGIRAGLAIKF